jgi:alcohol dehydrogenase YqhD (iron-dependent ADH family)
MEQSKLETPATVTATVPAIVPVTVTATAAEAKQVGVVTKEFVYDKKNFYFTPPIKWET